MLEEVGNGGGETRRPFFVSLVRRKLTHEVTGKHDFDYPGRADFPDGRLVAVA